MDTTADALPAALKTLQALRALGISVQMHAAPAAATAGVAAGAAASVAADSMGSMKSQFKRADASGARFALIFGADELAAGEVTLKSLRDRAGAQERQLLADPAALARKLQSSA